jgi:hypothetical protein
MALAAASLLFAAWYSNLHAAELGARTFRRPCTPELQKCLEKLEARLYFSGRSLDGLGGLGVEQALLELDETDAECALLLRGANLLGF